MPVRLMDRHYAKNLMQHHGAQFVFMGTLECSGTDVGKYNRLATCAKQRPEFKSWCDWGKGREGACKLVRADLAHISDFTFTQIVCRSYCLSCQCSVALECIPKSVKRFSEQDARKNKK